MRKKKVYNIYLDQETFKRLKKNKQQIVLQLNDDENKKIKIKDKIIFIDEVSNKKWKKKVKKIHHYSDYKDIDNKFSEEDIKKFGVLGIEVKRNRHIFIKVIFSILILILLCIGYHFVSNELKLVKSKKVVEKINEIKRDKLDYVFIEINPSFVLTIKDGKTEDVACLNDDCVAIYNEIDIKDKDINTSINELYSLSRTKGYDTTKGIRIKTTSDVNIEKKDYITIEYISEDIKDELLKDLKNNDSIKNNNNSDYYSTLWEELKKDQDYGEIYECSMNEKELECYIKKDIFLGYDAETPTEMAKVLQNRKNIARVLNKFGIRNEGVVALIGVKVEVANIYINDIKFECGEDEVCYINYNEDYDIEVSLAKSANGINLLNPNAVLNNVAFISKSYETSDNNENNIYTEHMIICDINKENCDKDTYRTCTFDDKYRLSRCKDIDSEKYNELISDEVDKNDICWCGIANDYITVKECEELLEERRKNVKD